MFQNTLLEVFISANTRGLDELPSDMIQSLKSDDNMTVQLRNMKFLFSIEITVEIQQFIVITTS